MKRVAIDDVEHPPTISPADVVRPLSGPLGTTDVALNYFELAPGETFGFDYHRHRDQEEVFYVLEGTAT
ncbi:MAG: cupin domain-containing protein, partial [Actinobacteria bacterium]|nr:cupin domain-containing protein [Actinomycetota bacterium]NIX23788.1 cupin domain-containing protein [Actinomycetota bacterium]